MTQPESLSRLLRLALETPGDESALRRLTAELIRLGHDAPPTLTSLLSTASHVALNTLHL